MTIRDSIVNADDLKTEEVYVPEWGVTVGVRTLTGHERDSYENWVYERQKNGDRLHNLRARLVAKSMVDKDSGERLFSDKESDIETLGSKSSRAIDRVYDAAQRLSATQESDVEELEGNSETTPGDASSSASRAKSA